MKQPIRLLIKPTTFMNQLQWSRWHWLIISIFLGLGVIETFVGGNIKFYEIISLKISSFLGLSIDASFIFLLMIKLFIMLFVLFLISYIIWLIGGLFSNKASLRVLIRRFATAFSILLIGYILQFFFPGKATVVLKYIFYFWGLILCFMLVKEQFNLAIIESLIVGCLAIIIAISTWYFSNAGIRKILNSHLHNQAKISLSKKH